MPEDFTPRRHEFGPADDAPDAKAFNLHAAELSALEDDLHLEPARRRALAAPLTGIISQATPRLAEHLAWLMARETDEMAAYSLHCAVLTAHPAWWTLSDWMRATARTTPFPMLRTAVLDKLLAENILDLDSDDDRALLDPADPAHRAMLQQHQWLHGSAGEGPVGELLAMLRPGAGMVEKSAALRIVRFSHHPEIGAQALAAVAALFRVERHPGLSLAIADVLVSKRESRIDLDMVADLIRAYHDDGVPTAEIALGRVFHEAEGFLKDSFGPAERHPSALAAALLAMFAPARTPDHGREVAQALTALSIDAAQPLVAFAATAALEVAHLPNHAGVQMVFDSARGSDDPAAQALAIRVLGQKPRALLPMLDQLKTLAGGPDTDPRVRRSAFHALVHTRQSALPTRIEEVIDLYFRYLRDAPFHHFADALHGQDVAKAPQHFIACLTESFDAIQTGAARRAALGLIKKPFGFGIAEAFEPFWPHVAEVMLRALDEPAHDDLHQLIFWNMLNTVPMPKPVAATFAAGLKERSSRLAYTPRIREMIVEWLEAHARG